MTVPRRTRRSTWAASAGGAVAACLVALPGAPAVATTPPPDAGATPPAPAEVRCAAAVGTYTGRPQWFLRALDVERVTPLATGAGVRVAVVSSGVDAGNAQLAGAVEPGVDLLDPNQPPADTDCDGRGTVVAGLIAARPVDATSFRGLAPAAQIVPVRVVQTIATGTGTTEEVGGGPALIAAGIRWAADSGVPVIVVTVATTEDDGELAAAVRDARAAGSLVVAGAPAEEDATDDESSTVWYPSGYEDVLAVTALTRDGTALGASQQGPHVDLAAPGGTIMSTAPVPEPGLLGHTPPVDDPSAATAFVAATAALLLERQPDTEPRDLQEQLLGSAVPGPPPSDDAATGAGLLDPYAAVATTPLDPRSAVGVSVGRPVPEPEGLDTLDLAALAIAGVGLVVLFVFGVTVTTARTRPATRPVDQRRDRSLTPR